MFERFTEGSRAVLVEAQSLSLEMGSGCIGVGHLLYGCAEGREETAGRPLRDGGITGASIRRLIPRVEQTPGSSPLSSEAIPGSEALADAEALRAIGIDYERVRSAVEETFGPGALETAPDRRVPHGNARKPPFTRDAKRSLELALRTAVELHHERLRPGHLLLGLFRLHDEFVSSSVEQSGATVAGVSAAVLTRLSVAAD